MHKKSRKSNFDAYVILCSLHVFVQIWILILSFHFIIFKLSLNKVSDFFKGSKQKWIRFKYKKLIFLFEQGVSDNDWLIFVTLYLDSYRQELNYINWYYSTGGNLMSNCYFWSLEFETDPSLATKLTNVSSFLVNFQ